jgi:hypothetical protein
MSLQLLRYLVCKAWKVFYIGRCSYMVNKSVVYRCRLGKAVKDELPIVKRRQPSVRFDSNDKFFNTSAAIVDRKRFNNSCLRLLKISDDNNE